MNDHPLIDALQLAPIKMGEEFSSDITGACFRKSFDHLLTKTAISHCEKPNKDEEYFEWIDILESVELAENNRYTILELGAGFARWSIRALRYALYKGITNCRAVAVEAEPTHAKWARLAFADNQIANMHFEIIEAGITDKGEKRHFYIQPSNDLPSETPNTWYGQSLAPPHHPERIQSLSSPYDGRQTYEASCGWKTIEVPTVTLASLLDRETTVDLVDMDIQGEEVYVIAASLSQLNAKVKRLHIGTHSNEIDAELIQILSKEGWKNKRTYLCRQAPETEYGKILFQDGVQTWLNPKFISC